MAHECQTRNLVINQILQGDYNFGNIYGEFERTVRGVRELSLGTILELWLIIRRVLVGLGFTH